MGVTKISKQKYVKGKADCLESETAFRKLDESFFTS